ncbi:hypothetical protein PMIN06_013022 [Paraphaeosphaeria minitans]
MYEAGYARRKPGWKPPLTNQEMQQRDEWAHAHNPDRYDYGDGQGFNFRQCVYTDETPACISEQRGMQRAWFWPEEKYDNNVKHDCIQKYCKLQFMELSRIITKVLAISTPRRQRQRQEL